MNTTLSVIIGLLLIFGVGSFVFVQKQSNDAAMQQESSSVNTNTNTNFNSSVTLPESEAENEREDEDEDEDDAVQTVSGSSGGAAGSDVAETSAGSTGIMAAVVAEHNTRTSCWTSINGNVYDLTSWIPKHPGGEQAILQLCGIDGSEKFNRKHGGGQSQATILAGFKIGVLAQ